jgi:iron complex outermembrane receptor protein
MALAVALVAAPAAAQEVGTPATTAQEAGAQGDIVVTGSRIRRDPTDQAQPVVSVDEQSIARTGLTSVADVLQRLPGSGGGLNTKVNNAGNIGGPPDGTGVSSGSAELDLRYLGAKRTLVLVDGLRYVNGSAAGGIPASVDFNSIPINFVERVEVLQSGASPLYGSDAIAGVVNVITKQEQRGLKASAQFGTYRAGDGDTWNATLDYGVQSDTTGTSVVFGGYYTKQDGVRTADRRISQFPSPYGTTCAIADSGCSSATPRGRYDVLGQSLTLDAPVIGRAPTLADYRDYGGNNSVDGFNFAPFNYLLTPSERYGGWLSFKQEVGEGTNLRVKAIYNRRNSQTEAAFLPLFIGPDAGNGNLLDRISIDGTNPFNPFGTLSSGVNLDGTPSGVPANYSTVRRRFVEGGTRKFSQNVDTFSLTATLDGSFAVGDRTLYWDVNGTYGLNDAHQVFTGNLNAARLAQALGPVAQCTGECVPFNVFGGVGSITPAMLDFVTFDQRDKSRQQLVDFQANLSGDLFDLPGGAVGFALGYEHRDQSASYDPDPIIVAGLGADVPTSPSRGRFDVDEVYGEIRIPLLRDTPFFNRLEVSGAVRHSDYSSFGSNTVFTASGLWKPVSDFSVRGGYAESLRAPSIGELYAGASRSDATINDPCTSAAGGAFTGNATVRTNCIAQGVPNPANLLPGQVVYAEPTGGQIGIFSRGNSGLKPETAKTWTAGAVYSPAWARGGFASAMSLEVNYFNISLTNAVDSVPGTLTLNRCAFLADPVSCAAITRSGNGSVSSINATLQNLNGILTDGIDATFVYRSPSFGGDVTAGLSLNASWLFRYNVKPPAELNAPIQKCVGTERCLASDQAFPRFKGNATVDVGTPAFGASFTGRYISSVLENNGNRMKKIFYGDAQVFLSPGWMNNRLRLTAGVNNIFNTNPPACFTCDSANFDPTTYDIPGQFGYLRLSFGL